MNGEEYILDCPECGPVQGFGPAEYYEEHDLGGDMDMAIEEDAVRTPVGLATKVRCPECGLWVDADRVSPQ